MKKYNTFLFDADGTLIDTRDMIFECFKHTLKKFANIDADETVISNIIGLPYREQIEKFIPAISDRDYTILRDDHIKHQNRIFKDYLSLCQGVFSTLKNLRKAGKILGVVTSRNMETLKPFFEYFGIYEFFTIFVTPADTKLHKPNPEPVLFALEKLNCDKRSTVFVGDAVFDIESGNRAGVDTCWTSWSPVDVSTSDPTFIIDDMRDLLKYI